MPQDHFWYVDDEQAVRWAVRVSTGTKPGDDAGPNARIVFTSRHAQISVPYSLDKEEHELTRYEVLEMLGEAKLASVAWRGRSAA